MICFDTSPLIWGVRGEATRGQEEMIERASRYLRHLDSLPKKRPTDKVMMFPAPALSEYLVGCKSQEQREAELRVIERHFRIPALDIPAAVLAAEISASSEMRALMKSKEFSRHQLRVDAFIIAIAIHNKAEKLITHDERHFKKLSAGRIEVTRIPDVDPPQGVFGFTDR